MATSTEPPFNNYATTNVSGNVAGARGISNYLVGKNVHFQAYARAVDQSMGSQRIWVVETDQTVANMGASDSPTGNYIGFRYSTSAPDSNWKCVMDNNSVTNTVVDSGIAADANGHRFEVLMNDTGSAGSATFRIDGKAVCAVVSALYPTNNTLLSMEFAVTTLTTGVRDIQFSRLDSFQDPRR